jgi:hypothetical protein
MRTKIKTKKVVAIISRVLMVAIIIGIIAFPFVWPRITFNKDYTFIKNLFKDSPGLNPFDFPLPSISFKVPVRLTVDTLSGKTGNLKGMYMVKDFRFRFADDDFDMDRLSGPGGILENDRIKIMISDSVSNMMLIQNKSIISFLAQRSKGKEMITAFQQQRDPFEKLKKVLESDLSGIDKAKDMSSRYLGLYLYGLKSFLLPRKEAEPGYKLIETGNFKGILFGNIGESDLKLMLYSPGYNHFFSVLFIKKKDAVVDNGYIDEFIASLEILK